jgi:hypothetical protein
LEVTATGGQTCSVPGSVTPATDGWVKGLQNGCEACRCRLVALWVSDWLTRGRAPLLCVAQASRRRGSWGVLSDRRDRQRQGDAGDAPARGKGELATGGRRPASGQRRLPDQPLLRTRLAPPESPASSCARRLAVRHPASTRGSKKGVWSVEAGTTDYWDRIPRLRLQAPSQWPRGAETRLAGILDRPNPSAHPPFAFPPPAKSRCNSQGSGNHRHAATRLRVLFGQQPGFSLAGC